MQVSLYTVQVGPEGKISTMAKPRGGDWLPDEMRSLAEMGVVTLVSALSASEIRDAGLASEAAECEAAGIKFVEIPIPDRATPDLNAIRSKLAGLSDELNEGHHVAVHCRFGIGRSSLIAAALLVMSGSTPDDAWCEISQARGLPVPDTPEQRDWVVHLVSER
jgi:protein-tyrosine phosphatase